MESDGWREPLFQLVSNAVETAHPPPPPRGCITWKTLGALTREARAEESVAEKIPAVMRGPNPDTMLMTLRRERASDKAVHPTDSLKVNCSPRQFLPSPLPVSLTLINQCSPALEFIILLFLR